MEPKTVDLYEFLVESELQQYYNSLKNDLKITTIAHLKYATDEDLRQVCGLSRPEIRRLRKYYEKYYPHGYLNKIKRLLQTPSSKKDEGGGVGSPTTSVEPLKSCPSPSKIPNNKHIIPADAITVNKQLGTGEFGIVQQGVWTNGTERIQVAIKCLCRERMQSNPMEFLKEAGIMHSIEHENIVRLYGVVLDTESLMLVTELAHLRSLLECLKDPGLRVSFLTVPTLCEFAAQICNGMMYLENKRLIHRDLAARNILVFSKNKVKISDFGLSRALGVGKDYYQTNFNINLKLPIAWCAPECINFLRFTNASDVWAYGVCLWEIFSYGFQPWAALTGHQILEAIDEPNYQRLEKPECCPKEYYSLMLKCWQHDATKRPKFTEIYQLLPDMKPEQLKTIVSFSEPKKDHLLYRQGEIITVLDKSSSTPYWKGVLNSGKTGLFNPANTVAYLDSLPSSVNRDSFSRTSERTSKRKIRTDMISRPQNDLKHTGHVGIDGAYFGDVAFLASPQNLPRQIVTPYKPSEDLEQTPLLLPPTPTSPDSIQTASGYFSDTLQTGHQNFVNAGESHDRSTVDSGLASAFDFRNSGFKDSNPFINVDVNGGDINGGHAKQEPKASDQHEPHEYHEISDDDIPTEKVFSGTSLLDEMENIFKNFASASEQQQQQHSQNHGHHGQPPPPLSPDVENTNKRNELTEQLSSRLNRKNSSSSGTMSSSKGGTKSSKKKTSTVKPISVKDEKLLNHAIEIANEISAKSMTDLVSDSSQQTSSPKRKFSFRFPHIHGVGGHHHHHHGGGTGSGSSGGGSGISLKADQLSSLGSGGSSGNGVLGGGSGVGGVGGGGSGTGGGGGPSGSGGSGSRGSGSDKDHLASGSGSSSGHHHHHHHHGTGTLSSAYRERRNFSEEAKNVPDLHSTITEEHRQAYNSLVQNPSGVVGVFTNELKCFTASTLPRSRFSGAAATSSTGSFRFKEIDLTSPPTHYAPKSPGVSADTNPMAAGSEDSNPLRMLRSKNFPVVRPRLKIQTQSSVEDGGSPSLDDKDGPCESPSYLTNPEYTYNNAAAPAATTTATSGGGETDGETGAANPIPLPPRDRNKVIAANPKRHVRKHPLIIPASGLQRTLSKVTQITPVEEKADIFTVPNDDSVNLDSNNVLQKSSSDSSKLNEIGHSYVNNAASSLLPQKTYTKDFVENNFPKIQPLTTLPATIPSTSTILTRRRNEKDAAANRQSLPRDPTYENLDVYQTTLNNIDSASLHCESILEGDSDGKIAAVDLSSPSSSIDVVDSFTTALYDIEDVLRNVDLDQTKTIEEKNLLRSPPPPAGPAPTLSAAIVESLSSSRPVPPPPALGHDEPDGAAAASVGGGPPTPSTPGSVVGEAGGGELKKSINYVSCEDLLEFAEKPKGRARGLESDEVRIMSKVLGKNTPPEQCLVTLDFIEWDIHKAIKLCKLQNILASYNLSLQECREALQNYDWDLHTTALKLKNLHH